MFKKIEIIRKKEKFFWTQHSKIKMRQYRFSERRVLHILRKPDRKEEGIALGTIAQMQITGTKKNPTEAWIMFQVLKKSKGIKILFACSGIFISKELNPACGYAIGFNTLFIKGFEMI